MNDKEFTELRLKTICPSADEIPSAEHHQQVFKAAAKELRDLVGDAYAKLDALDTNPDLSVEGKQRHQRKIASDAITKIERSRTSKLAREACESMLREYQKKDDGNIRRPTDANEIAVHAQIRDRLRDLTDARERMRFLERHGSDLVLISAILTAPPYLGA
jgi:hypothetical protein